MTINIKNLCIALVFAMLAPFQVSADEVTDVINEVAAKLVQQLPMDKKIALKSLSPEETGLPEDFLRKLTSDLEAALLTASDFEINLANRATMEDVWQEAVEFNNANFDELFKSANADVMLMMSPRAISTGVEISITAYALTGDNVGKTLASSGSVLLPIDLQANLGVDVNDLNQQMSQVLAEIEKVGQTGGLISGPNTYAEFYHNARILQQRGEVDLAMRNYEQALETGREFEFVDPLMDLIDLASARYGSANVGAYIAKKLLDRLSPNLQEFALLYSSNSNLSNFLDISDTTKLDSKFTPSLVLWLNQRWRDLNLEDEFRSEITADSSFYVRDFFLLEVAREIQNDLSKGNLQKFFIDDIRAMVLVDVQKLTAIEKTLNRFEFVMGDLNYQTGTGDLYALYPPNCSWWLSQKKPYARDPARWLDEVSSLNFPDNDTERLNLLKFLKATHSACSNVDSSVPLARLVPSRSQTKPVIINADLANNMGPCAPPEGCFLPLEISFQADRIQPLLIDGYEKYDTNSLKGLYAGYSMNSLEILPTTDRVIFGDYFAQLARDFDNNTGIIGRISGETDIKFNIIGGFMITDNVDVNQPILLTMCDERGELNSCRVHDITEDGTYFRSTGVPLHVYTEGEGIYVMKKTDNGWLFVPGWIQSSIGRKTVRRVSYTSSVGIKKTLTKGFASGDKNFEFAKSLKRTTAHPVGQAFGYSVYKNAFYKTTKSKPVAKTYCSLANPKARIINVQNFTNLRRQAGLNGRVIGQVPLGATVSVVNPGSFLRYDRCAATCNGTNQNAIKQCIDNNDVWIEVQYNGRRGFLSRKFLE